jgi:hypothetical protein
MAPLSRDERETCGGRPSASPGPCPRDLALEEYLLDVAPESVVSHVERCAGCRADLRRMAAEGDHFTRFVYPETAPAVWKAADRGAVGAALRSVATALVEWLTPWRQP